MLRRDEVRAELACAVRDESPADEIDEGVGEAEAEWIATKPPPFST